MKPLMKLLLTHAWRHKTRTLITLFAIAVSITGVGFNLYGLQQGYRQQMVHAHNMGRFKAMLMPASMGTSDLSNELVTAMLADPLVQDADPMYRLFLVDVVEPQIPSRGPFSGASLIGTDATLPPQELATGKWLDADGEGAVISSTFKERAGLDLGDNLKLRSDGGALTAEVVGIVAVDAMPTGRRMMPPAHVADIWLTRSRVKNLCALPDKPSLVAFDLKDEAAVESFVENWHDKVATAYPPATLRTVIDEAVDFLGRESSETKQMLQATSTFLWTMLAGFIVFFSLSIGARNRVRQIAILRALSMSRIQAILLIGAEALGYAILGWLIGMLLLMGLLSVMGSFTPGPGAGGPGFAMIIVSLCCALVGSLLAALPVSLQVACIKPIDILGRRGANNGKRVPAWMMPVGILCILFNPVIILLGRHEAVREFLSYLEGGHVGFGAPIFGSVLMIVGFALITPQAIRAAERLFTPTGSRLLRLDGRFLRQQLSANLWRNAGTTIALSAGLALYITSLVWGFSMLVPFTPTDAMPRMQLTIPQGLSEEGIDAVRSLPGVINESFLPTLIEHPRLSKSTLERPGFEHVHAHQQNVLIMGLDPKRAFGGESPIFDFDYLEGDPEATAGLLSDGRHCIIPDNFATQCQLKVGDSFAVELPNEEGREITYTIAAVAHMPGWNWLTKFSGVRKRAVRALAMIFVSHDQLRTDYGLERTTHFWFEVNDDLLAAQRPDPRGKPAGLQDAPDRGGPEGRGNRGPRGSGPAEGKSREGAQPNQGDPPRGRGMRMTSPAAEALSAKVKPIVLHDLGLPPDAIAPKITVTDTEAVNSMLDGRAGSVIRSMTLMPLIMLAISSLAVCNTILASVRTRFWQFGVLRSVGMTRGQLVRMILCESLQLWAAAAVLSLVSGIALGWAGTRLCTLLFFFAGHTPPLVIPWGGIALGLAAGVIVCLAGAVVPALIFGRREPLHFIQKGHLAT